METIAINYWAIIGGAIFLVIMGVVWYGPLFGRMWMKIVGAEDMTKEEMEKTQKEMIPMYLMQFVVSLITSYVFYYFVKGWNTVSGIENAFWIWLGFMMPQASGAMWDTKKGYRLRKFLILAGYQLVTLLILGWAFSRW